MYDFETKRVISTIKKKKAKRVLIQLPEGLKKYAPKIMDIIREETKAEPIFSGDPCFGACDLIEVPEADLLIHYGHAKMISKPNVVYVPCFSDQEVTEVIDKATKKLDKTVGLITTVQHVKKLEEIKKQLKEKGIKAIIGKKSGRIQYDGQVLGCEFSTALSIKNRVDSFLYIGSGRFHPLGAAYYTGKNVMRADPFTKEIEIIKPKAFEHDKYLRKTKSFDSRTFGIIVGQKPGQHHMKTAEEAAKKIRAKDKKAYLLELNDISPQVVDYLPFDAFVITACPRIVLDDWRNYRKPIILPDEI